MDIILCHTTADFDTLGAAVGLSRLQPGSRIVLTGGCHPTVQRFVALHRDEYALIDQRAVNPSQIRSLTLVDAQQPERFGVAADWIDQAQRRHIPIILYDHHPATATAVAAQSRVVEAVGAATTLVVEAIQHQGLEPTVAEATVMALGIHVDTGSLLFEQTTVRDAAALTWLMGHGASLRAMAEFVEPGLSPVLQDLLGKAMATLRVEVVQGYSLAWVLVEVGQYIPGLSGLVERLIALADVDVLVFGASYSRDNEGDRHKLTLIGRAQGRLGLRTSAEGLDLGALLSSLGGGGHPTAASVTLSTEHPEQVLGEVLGQVRTQLPHAPTARDLMSSPVRTIRPGTTIGEAQRILLRYGHSGLSVVDADDHLVGIISRRDIDLALHHGFSHAPVKGYMATSLKTITPETSLADIEHLMVTYDIGRLPVLADGILVGIVTRTDLLRHLHRDQLNQGGKLGGQPLPQLPPANTLQQALATILNPSLRAVLQPLATAAQERGWHLYLVGGAVRDLLLNQTQGWMAGSDSSGPDSSGPDISLPDLDVVVDGFYQSAQVGAGVELAEVIKARFPEVELQVHGRFQTASLVWHKDLDHALAGVMIDIATARTEFYPYPAANPEVEASSIQQDLYRRDFTINAMALRLTQPRAGQLLDYFGGLEDLRQGTVRVLHANSFIEDPTRIYRAVRFAVRLGFSLAPQTEGYIHHAIDSGIYTQMQRQGARVPALQVRLKNELKYILEAPYWQPALTLLDQLQALRCLHSDLAMSPQLWQQLRRVTRWLERFDWAHRCTPWQLRLEILLAAVPPGDRRPLAMALQLTDSSIERLGQLEATEQRWLTQLCSNSPPSQVQGPLAQADLSTLLLVSARHPRHLGPLVWRYLTDWSKVTPLIDGERLKTLGYAPGPAFRPMLEAVFAAQLDGVVQTQAEAERFLVERYPQPVKPSLES